MTTSSFHFHCTLKLLYFIYTYAYLKCVCTCKYKCLEDLLNSPYGLMNRSTFPFCCFWCFGFSRQGFSAALEPVLELALGDQADLELTEITCLCPQVLGLKACATAAWPLIAIFADLLSFI